MPHDKDDLRRSASSGQKASMSLNDLVSLTLLLLALSDLLTSCKYRKGNNAETGASQAYSLVNLAKDSWTGCGNSLFKNMVITVLTASLSGSAFTRFALAFRSTDVTERFSEKACLHDWSHVADHIFGG
jgi:hypothetical protein